MEIRACCGQTARIAYQGENDRMQVRFDISDIMAEFPGGVAALTVRRPGDTEAVASNSAVLDGTDLVWTVSAWECERQGFLYAQIVYSAGETVAKTKIYRFSVSESLITSVDPEPDDWADWVEGLMTAAAATQAAVDSYNAMTATATGLPEGSTPTAEIDHSGENPVLKLGIPKGDTGDPGQDGAPGADGYSPSASVSKSGKTATITITDKDGTTTATVSDGEDGSPGDPTELIDDTAGSGATGKTWSADKLSDLKNEIQQKQNAPGTAGTAGQVLALDSNLDPVWSTPQSGSAESEWVNCPFEPGYIVTSSATVDMSTILYSGSLEHCVVSCSEGDQFKITGTGRMNPRLWAFVDANSAVLSVSGEDVTENGLILTAPENAVTLIVNVICTGTCLRKGTVKEYAEQLNREKSPVILKSASGTIATFNDGADGLPLESMVISINAVQSGTGDPSPENIRPITGKTKVSAYVSGHNLLPGNVPTSLRKGTISNSKIASATNARVFSFAVPKNAGLYATKKSSDSDAGNVGVVDNFTLTNGDNVYENKGFSGAVAQSVSTGNHGFFVVQAASILGTLTWWISRELMVTIGNARETYVKPQLRSEAEVDWSAVAGTVYGGTVDIVKGILTVTHGQIASYNGETLPGEWISDRDVYASGTTPTTGAQVVYELAQAITYYLTPVEMRSVLGVNHAWADNEGTVTLTYCADTGIVTKKAVTDVQVNGSSVVSSGVASVTVPVTDVQVNGTSILSQGVANVPMATASTLGVVKTDGSLGTGLSTGKVYVATAYDDQIKAGTQGYKPIVPLNQHQSVFYGLAKAAGDSTQSSSANTVGTYTESAKSAISGMLNAPETVSGSTPTINAKAGVRYICGEVSTLTIVVPASGIIDVTFESGSTPTVLTVTPPTGMTMRWANSFDPTSLEANTTYEINIADGCLGVACAWT
jgi:hypothetical protein